MPSFHVYVNLPTNSGVDLTVDAPNIHAAVYEAFDNTSGFVFGSLNDKAFDVDPAPAADRARRRSRPARLAPQTLKNLPPAHFFA